MQKVALIDLLTEARQRQQHISANLPKGVDPLAFENPSSKTPYVALCCREAQIWRAEEFARAACDLLERGDFVAGVTVVRSLTESVASIWFLMEKIETQIKKGLAPDIHEQLVTMLMGHKDQPGLPDAINVLTMIDKVDKKLPGFRKNYDRMSEFVHPNWSGALGAYGRRDPETLITHFERDAKKHDYGTRLALNSLIGALEMLEFAYNRILDLLPEFEGLLE